MINLQRAVRSCCPDCQSSCVRQTCLCGVVGHEHRPEIASVYAGPGQAEKLAMQLEQSGRYSSVSTARDQFRVERFVIGRCKSAAL